MTKRKLSSNASSVEYEDWTKQELISKLRQLESTSKSEHSARPRHFKTPRNTPRPFDFDKHSLRFIALRFAYMGWNYSGLAYQAEPTPLPTVEQVLLDALAKTKLITDADPNCCDFSRCGRTDRGVSAMNQVISLKVRSNLLPEDQKDPSKDSKELPYINILNSLLPADIRLTAVSLRPNPGFDARFSCKYRHYRYFFRKGDLDIELMNEAAHNYEGTHDFRNFCKIDGSKQITNYTRQIMLATIMHSQDDYYFLDLKGLAFLWHQVRCMMAILFAVGQGLEQPSIVTQLMDVAQYPRKPHFEMANDIPLILYDCVFPEMEWTTTKELSNKTKQFRSFQEFAAHSLDLQLKAQVAKIFETVYTASIGKLEHTPGCGTMNVGNGSGRNYTKYIPIARREMGEPFEHVNARHREKKAKRAQDQNTDLKNGDVLIEQSRAEELESLTPP